MLNEPMRSSNESVGGSTWRGSGFGGPVKESVDGQSS